MHCYVGIVFLSAMICSLRITVSVSSVISSDVLGGTRHSVYGDGILDSLLIYSDSISLSRFYVKWTERFLKKVC